MVSEELREFMDDEEFVSKVELFNEIVKFINLF